MEDYIFIIIALLLSAFGAINKQKKKREEAMRDMDEEAPSGARSVFEQLFEDDFFRVSGTEPNKVPPPAERPVSPPRKKKAASSTKLEAPPKMEYKPLQRENLKHSYSKPKRTIEVAEIEKLSREDEAKLTPKNLILKDFSLRKAVIYSEILGRRY